MITCACGADVPADDKFCGKCGAQVPTRPATAEEATPTVFDVWLTGLIPSQPRQKTRASTDRAKSVLSICDAAGELIMDVPFEALARFAQPIRTSELSVTWWPGGRERSVLLGFQDASEIQRFKDTLPFATVQSAPTTSDANESPASSSAKSWGTALIALGAIGVVYFFLFFSTAVEVPTTSIMGTTIGGGYVNNLGLMHEQQMGLLVSIGAVIAGILLLVLHAASARKANHFQV